MANAESKGSSMRALVQTGFGLTLGGMLAGVLFIAVALSMLVGGAIMVSRELKKPKKSRNKPLLITGFVLLGMGVVVGLGLGVSTFLDMLSSSME